MDSLLLDVDRTTTAGCALGIYRDGQITYARGYGMANLELGLPIVRLVSRRAAGVPEKR